MGSGVSKTVHVDQSEYGVCSVSARSMFLFVAVIYGTSVNSLLQPKAMAEQTRDGGIEECRGFSPPNVPTASASSTRLPLDSLDLNTRVPNASAAIPPKIRRTESQRSADFYKKGKVRIENRRTAPA